MDVTANDLAPIQIRGEPCDASQHQRRTQDPKEREDPGQADSERRPLHPPVTRAGHEIDDHEERKDQGTFEEKADGVKKAHAGCSGVCDASAHRPVPVVRAVTDAAGEPWRHV